MIEPSAIDGVPILEALPPYEAELYSREENVIETKGKTDIEYQAIVKRYSFVGGTQVEYIIYFGREDVQDHK